MSECRKERSLLLGGKPKMSMEALTANLEALVESLTPDREELTHQEFAFAQACPYGLSCLVTI